MTERLPFPLDQEALLKRNIELKIALCESQIRVHQTNCKLLVSGGISVLLVTALGILLLSPVWSLGLTLSSIVLTNRFLKPTEVSDQPQT